MTRPTRLVLVVALAALGGLSAPAGASAGVGFGPGLASEASAPGVAAQAPAVAGNAAGVAATAYVQKVGAVNHAFARVKPAGTAAFAGPQELSTVDSSAPAVGVAPDGTVTVAWQQANACAGSKVFVATAPPSGAFGSGIKVSDNAFDPEVTVGPDGTVMVLYGRDTGSCTHEERVQVRPRQGSIVDQSISDPGFGSIDADGAAIGIDDSGTAIAAFTQSLTAAPFSTVLRVARRPANGAWTGTTLPGPGTSGSALGVAPDGHAVVAYNTKVTGGLGVEVRPLAPGAASFGAPQAITNGSVNDPLSGLAVSNDGAAAVTTASDNLARRAPGAATFGSAVPIGLPSVSNLIPAFPAGGELVLLDDEKLAGSARFSLVARLAPSGGALGAPQPTGLDSDATGTSLAAPLGANDLVVGWNHRPAGSNSFEAGVALGDGTPPALGAVSAPAGGLAGASLSFGAAPSDDLGVADVRWAFGDGASASGPAATHAFAAAGASDWSLTARDLGGNTTSATGALAISAPPQAVRPAAKLTVKIAKPRRGTRARRLHSLRGTASGPVTRVEVSVVRVLKPRARTARARCRTLGASGRLAARTRRASRTGCTPGKLLKAKGAAHWTLKLRRSLPAGAYVVFARARSATGAKSRVARVTFSLRG